VTCLTATGYLILKGRYTQIPVAQQFRPQRTVSEMEGRTKISLTGDGNQKDVIFLGLMPQPI
jgi:hypothetical protein